MRCSWGVGMGWGEGPGGGDRDPADSHTRVFQSDALCRAANAVGGTPGRRTSASDRVPLGGAVRTSGPALMEKCVGARPMALWRP